MYRFLIPNIQARRYIVISTVSLNVGGVGADRARGREAEVLRRRESLEKCSECFIAV